MSGGGKPLSRNGMMKDNRQLVTVLWQRMPTLALLLAVLLISHALAGLTWQLLTPLLEQDTIPAAASMPSGRLAAPDTRADLASVADLQLLGRAEEAEVAAPVVVDAPETRLNIALKGVLSRPHSEDARALIAVGNDDEKPFRVGDSLSAGAVLHEILKDRVILQRAGRFETLTLPKERMDIAASASPASSATALAPRGRVGGAGGVSQQLRELRDTLIQSPQDAMRLVNVQPVMEDGRLKGYSVRPGQDRRLFGRVGLRPGDVVTAVNGIPLNDPGQLGGLYQELASANRIQIAVERRGRSTELTLDLE